MQSSVVFEGKELSPGLCYLEWVCQKMELYAKHQMQNQAMQAKTDTPQEHEEQKVRLPRNSFDSLESIICIYSVLYLTCQTTTLFS